MEGNKALSGIPAPLLKWYDQNARILPWRELPTAYRVWVSEIMLQQTRVEAVKPYFERFIDRLPSVESLALAEEETLLKLWEGLGYYSRVKNLHRAAVAVMEQYGGNLPADYKKLLALPGIGEYTAGAIASIAFGIPAPAVDGNVLRVVSRLTENGGDILQGTVKREMAGRVAEALPKDRAGAFNQALMELGAVICVPNGAPKCDACPLSSQCGAFQNQTIGEYPKKTKKKPRRKEERLMFVIVNENRLAIRKRGEKGLLSGLWEIPSIEGFPERQTVAEALLAMGFAAEKMADLGSAKHIFTHIEWHMRGLAVKTKSPLPPGFVYATPEALSMQYALPSAFRYFQELFMNGEWEHGFHQTD